MLSETALILVGRVVDSTILNVKEQGSGRFQCISLVSFRVCDKGEVGQRFPTPNPHIEYELWERTRVHGKTTQLLLGFSSLTI